mmetsp:Transcript_28196/g.67025  ORF Transcript_28196/g.67025 Transcript_28196/m.67025 type:complete len:290 (-) Transcript_28196:891-1760(-)
MPKDRIHHRRAHDRLPTFGRLLGEEPGPHSARNDALCNGGQQGVVPKQGEERICEAPVQRKAGRGTTPAQLLPRGIVQLTVGHIFVGEAWRPAIVAGAGGGGVASRSGFGKGLAGNMANRHPGQDEAREHGPATKEAQKKHELQKGHQDRIGVVRHELGSHLIDRDGQPDSVTEAQNEEEPQKAHAQQDVACDSKSRPQLLAVHHIAPQLLTAKRSACEVSTCNVLQGGHGLLRGTKKPALRALHGTDDCQTSGAEKDQEEHENGEPHQRLRAEPNQRHVDHSVDEGDE